MTHRGANDVFQRGFGPQTLSRAGLSHATRCVHRPNMPETLPQDAVCGNAPFKHYASPNWRRRLPKSCSRPEKIREIFLRWSKSPLVGGFSAGFWRLKISDLGFCCRIRHRFSQIPPTSPVFDHLRKISRICDACEDHKESSSAPVRNVRACRKNPDPQARCLTERKPNPRKRSRKPGRAATSRRRKRQSCRLAQPTPKAPGPVWQAMLSGSRSTNTSRTPNASRISSAAACASAARSVWAT